mgnify:CR=1 FL=1
MNLFYGIGTLFLAAIYVLFQVNGLNNGMFLASALYGVLITFFLLILVWGFTKSHISYLKKIEDVKKQVLEVEGVLPCKQEKKI